MRGPMLWLLGLMLALLAAMAAKSLLVAPPPVDPRPAAGAFDTARAAARLERILGDERPHPADTPAGNAVRQRLLAEIAAMGLSPVVRDTTACNEFQKGRGVSCARVRNVLVTIGPQVGRHLLLNTHYDSSIAGPGAGDAGAGVATLLEVASILRRESLGRPVTLLFNEGEELGLIGARAFLERDPVAARVDSLINLEARGSTGPVVMFETSVPNASPVRAFARAVERPVANSLATDAYRQLPNYTDVNSFAERGWLTLNFGFIGNETRYHSAGDTLAALDRRSLQHMGDQVLALTRELSAGVGAAEGSLLYMDVAGRGLVVLPMALGMLILVLLVALFGWLSFARQSIWRGTATMVGGLLLATAVSWLAITLLGMVRGGMFWRGYPVWTLVAVHASALAAALAMLSTLGRRLDAGQLRAAFWFTFLAIGGAVALIAPGGIIYFLFPPLIMAVGALVGRWLPRIEAIAAILAGLALYLTFGAMLGLLEEMLSNGPLWLFAPLGLLVMLPFLIEAKPLIDSARRPLAIGLGTVLALAGWAGAAAAPAYSDDRRQRLTIEYGRDAAEARSFWAIDNDGAPLPATFGDGWSRAEVSYSERKRWTRAAPGLDRFVPPALEPLAAGPDPRGRRVSLRLRPNGSHSVAIVAPEDSQILAAGVPGFVRPIDADKGDGDYVIRCTGRSCDGMRIDLVIGGNAPVTAKLVGVRPGLPPEAQPLLDARPALARPQYSTDAVITVRKIRF